MSDPKVGAIVFGAPSPTPMPASGSGNHHGLQPQKRRQVGPTPDQVAGMFDVLEPGAQIIPGAPLADVIQASIALSLKRIADHLESTEALKRIADSLAVQQRVEVSGGPATMDLLWSTDATNGLKP